MRHRVAGRRLGRTSEHRVAMRRNLAQSLIEHETISTTIEKAKEIKPFVEKLITLAKKGKLEHRRRAISLLGNRAIVDYEDGQAKAQGTVVGKLFSELGPRYLERPGGYTRIIRLSLRRLGDNGEVVLLQLLGEDEPLKKESKPSTKRKAGKKGKTSAKAKKQAEPVAEAEEEAVAEAVAEPTDAAREASEELETEAPATEPEQEDESKE
ncbi:MAG: 50S ribosomal protein L17 [Phycisphaerales bacterium]|nr:MAG: 50S ribosomal protein L17 [Phycisphaerales bacterium]